VKGSGTAGHVDINITSSTSPSPFFAMDTSSLPIWLTVDATTGTATVAGKSLRFSSTNVADTLAPGTYNATVRLKVSGFADLSIPMSLLVNNKAPKLSVAASEGTTRNLQWTIGTPVPTPVITILSSDSPIAYAATSGGTLKPTISPAQQKGLAYSFGTQIGVSFDPLIFAAAQPGATLTGTVTLTWGTPASTIVVTFNVTILSPGATLSGVTPASIPTAAAGQTFSVTLTGTGFVPSTDASLRTKVGIIVGGIGNTIVTDTNIAVTVTNPSNITLVITSPAVADPNLPFAQSGAGGTVMLGICNPGGASCNLATGTVTLTIGSGPIIQAVTSASAFQQVSAPALPSIAPYDMLSIFGANFCSSGGTGCSNTQLLYGTPDPVSLRFPATLSPDRILSPVPANPRDLSVTFLIHGGAAIANAPLLFATNGQINLMVPAAVSAYVGSTVDIQVNFGYGVSPAATLLQSSKFQVNVIATDPGIFAVGSDGQGDGAALNLSWALISSTNPAGMRSTGADSDTIQLYVTGLGAPDGTANNASAGGGGSPADCITVASYLTSLNARTGVTSWTDVDGTVIQSSLLNTGRFPPCEASAYVPTVTIGGVAATVTYAGFVPDTVAGLYQINVLLPGTSDGSFAPMSGAPVSTILAPMQLPVQITSNGLTSQNGVSIWVAPRLKVDPPTVVSGTVGIPWATPANLVVASEGTSSYRYAITSGVLPAGLTLTAATGAIAGTPAANTAGLYTVTVTATDSAVVPVTGSVTFNLTIAGGLFMTTASASPYTANFGTANAALTPVITATGGTAPYTFAITAPGTLPQGMTVSSTGRVGISTLTPAGTYHVTVRATDSAASPLTGTVNFDVVVNLRMANSAPATQSTGTGGILTTVSATGNTGTIVYTLDDPSLTLGLAIDASTGDVTPGTAPSGAPVSITVTATDSVTLAPGAAVFGAGTKTVTVQVVP
jgi:uncharacterized protein (TIGR03437 family)